MNVHTNNSEQRQFKDQDQRLLLGKREKKVKITGVQEYSIVSRFKTLAKNKDSSSSAITLQQRF